MAVLRCVTTQGPAFNTVAGRTSPLVSNNCVMPTLRPRIPATVLAMLISIQRSVTPLAGLCRDRRPRLSGGAKLRSLLFVFLTERLDLDVHTRRQIELHQRIDRLLGRLENVEQTLV